METDQKRAESQTDDTELGDEANPETEKSTFPERAAVYHPSLAIQLSIQYLWKFCY